MIQKANFMNSYSHKFERNIVEFITELMDDFLAMDMGHLSKHDVGKMLVSLYNVLRVRFRKSLADPSKLKIGMEFPPHQAIALKYFLQMQFEVWEIDIATWEGNEILKLIAEIDQQYI